MIVKRRWMELEPPYKIIKEDEYTYNWPEDWEVLMWPDEEGDTPGEYNTLFTSFYQRQDLLVHFCKRRTDNEDNQD